MILCLLPMISVISSIHLVGDWPSEFHQSFIGQVFQCSGQAFMATVAAEENKSPAILHPAQSPTYLFLGTKTWTRGWTLMATTLSADDIIALGKPNPSLK